MAIKPHVLRKIAASQLEEMFPGQAREAREELITSVVRQWTTYDGNAGIFTVPVHYYLTANSRMDWSMPERKWCEGPSENTL